MNFGQAIEALKAGDRVARVGWNGKGMWLYLWNTLSQHEPSTLPYIVIKTADGDQVPWLASQTDMLADDWVYAVGNGSES